MDHKWAEITYITNVGKITLVDITMADAEARINQIVANNEYGVRVWVYDPQGLCW